MFAQLSTSLHRQLLEKHLKENSRRLHGAILDVGSGGRRYDHLFAGTVTAVDIRPDPERHIIFADVSQELPFSDNTFDAVICLEVLEYVPNLTKALQEIRRVIKPGGTVMVSVPFLYHDHDDAVRYTKAYLTARFSAFPHVASATFGNAFTTAWDIARKKALNSHRPLWRYLFLPLLVITYHVIQHTPVRLWSDRFYSGIFIVAKK